MREMENITIGEILEAADKADSLLNQLNLSMCQLFTVMRERTGVTCADVSAVTQACVDAVSGHPILAEYSDEDKTLMVALAAHSVAAACIHLQVLYVKQVASDKIERGEE